MIRVVLAALLISLFQTGMPQQAKAEELNWTLRNEHLHVVYIRFFSRSRNHEWPGNGLTYPFTDNENHTQTLVCRRGESICFGGFNGNRTLSWGVGEDGLGGCESCCRICGELYVDVDVLN